MILALSERCVRSETPAARRQYPAREHPSSFQARRSDSRLIDTTIAGLTPSIFHPPPAGDRKPPFQHPHMRLFRTIAIAALAVANAAAAQGPTPPPQPAGCRGTISNTSSIELLGRSGGESLVIPSYPVIESVQPGSPAELAGLRPGDMLVLQEGMDVVAHPVERPLLAGETVHFVVRRDGAEVPITVVLGRWDPAQETPDVTRTCRPVP